MKNKLFLGMIVCAVLAIGLVLAGCGAADPKALAKQSYDIGLQALGAMFNPQKAAELEKKVADIEKKVAKLSESDRAIYDEELARLSSQAFGGLFDTASEAAGGLLDAASDLSDEDVQEALDTAQNALDTAQEAANALKAFGF